MPVSRPNNSSAKIPRPCAFFDRDGVLNRDTGYTYKPADLEWQPGAQAAVKRLNDADYLVVVVTNQSGVARGLYAESDIDVFHDHMQAGLAIMGARIDAFYACPYHSEGSIARYVVADHPHRKPNPGMILQAMRDLPIRREGSFLIGDRQSDLAAAAAVGLPHALYSGGDLDALVREMMANRDPS